MSKEPSIHLQLPKTERIILNNKDETPKTEINQLPKKKGINNNSNFGFKKNSRVVKKKYNTSKDIFKAYSTLQKRNSKLFSYKTSQAQYQPSKPLNKANPFNISISNESNSSKRNGKKTWK